MSKININNIYHNSFGDKYFTQINGHAFDNVGSSAIFNSFFSKELDVENNLFIVVGADSGLLINYLQKYQADKNRRYLILERPEIISYLKKNIDINNELIDIQPFDIDFTELKESYIEYISHGRFSLLKSLAVIDNISALYKEMWEMCSDKFNIFYSSEVAFSTSNNIFVDSQLRNLSVNEIPVANIKNSLENSTAIILGGGPTLDENITWIRDNQNKLIIFAAARIADRLNKEKIQPDFFISVDPHDVSYDNSKSILAYAETAILIHSNNANSKLLAEWTGLHSYLGLRFPWLDSKHKQPNNLAVVGPTVTNAMASIASFLGAKQIIFSGVDFCYSKDGNSHESGSLEAKISKYVGASSNRVKTYSGRIAETDANFADAHAAMIDQVAYAIKQFNNTFYTLSKESAFIDKVTYIKANKILLTQQDKQPLIKEIKHKLQVKPNHYNHHLAEAKSYCQEMLVLCKKTIKLSSKGKKIANQLFIDDNKTDTNTRQVIKIQKNLNKLMGDHAEFIFMYSIKAYKEFMDPSIKQDDMSKENITQSFVNYFEALIKSASPLSQAIQISINILNLRVDEIKDIKQLPKLIDKWYKYKQEGRANVWLKMHNISLDDLPLEYKKDLQSILETYNKELLSTNTKITNRIKLQDDSIKPLFNRIQRYFDEEKIAELELIISHIKTKNKDYSEDLCNIARGYLLELKELPSEALAQYIAIKDKNILMYGLKRVVSITLAQKDYPSALNALAVLTNYSDQYYKAYADILNATGRHQEAIEIYLHYLQTNDKDTSSWIKLAKVLIYTGILDEAINAINKIKQHDPENPIADELMILATKPKY